MTPRNFLPLLFILAVALCSPLAAKGDAKPRATPPHHHTVIETVSATSITISQADGEHTYKINATTEISFKGQTATVDQLQPGMRVQVTPDGADDTIAGAIVADDAPKDPAPKPGKNG